jgi:drug/metabolite transporter (DMT)-like permease
MAVVPFALLTLGERGISSGTASVLNTTAPLWATLVAFVAGVRPPGASGSPAHGRVVGFALGTLGVVVLVGVDRNGSPLDALIVLGSTALYSSAGVYAQVAFAAAPPFAPPLLTTALGAMIALPLGVLGWLAHPPTSGAILASCVAGALPNGVAYMAYFLLVRRLGATRTLSVTYLTPVVALMLGAAFLSERVTLTDFIGLSVILTGVAVVHGRLAPRLRFWETNATR